MSSNFYDAKDTCLVQVWGIYIVLGKANGDSYSYKNDTNGRNWRGL